LLLFPALRRAAAPRVVPAATLRLRRPN